MFVLTVGCRKRKYFSITKIMAESVFDIFGDRLTRSTVKNVSRQPLCNIENMGKSVSGGPIKPNEPAKKALAGEGKKTFMCNAGKAMPLQGTPRAAFTPRTQNLGPLIYSDGCAFEQLEFTKPPAHKYDDCDIFDFLLAAHAAPGGSPPRTPPPPPRPRSPELMHSLDDPFTDDISMESFLEEDLGLPALY